MIILLVLGTRPGRIPVKATSAQTDDSTLAVCTALGREFPSNNIAVTRVVDTQNASLYTLVPVVVAVCTAIFAPALGMVVANHRVGYAIVLVRAIYSSSTAAYKIGKKRMTDIVSVDRESPGTAAQLRIILITSLPAVVRRSPCVHPAATGGRIVA